MGFFIPVYLAVIVLMGLTIGWAATLARKSGQRLHQFFLFFVIVSDLAGLSDILFRFLPARLGPASVGSAQMVSGFLAFPLMAAFSYLAVAWLLALGGLPFPGALIKTFAGYWGLLFFGFLAAEFRQIGFRDMRLTHLLEPFFDAAIIASGLGAALYVLIRVRPVDDPRERRFVRTVCGYFLVVFVGFGILFFIPLPIAQEWNILARSFMGMAYLLPPLTWMTARLRETGQALLMRVAGDAEGLDRWLEANNLSPRERQIVRCVLEGKSNSAIGKELFIGLRTVESHLYSVYRKLGVKSRLQLARLAAGGPERGDDPRPRGAG